MANLPLSIGLFGRRLHIRYFATRKVNYFLNIRNIDCSKIPFGYSELLGQLTLPKDAYSGRAKCPDLDELLDEVPLRFTTPVLGCEVVQTSLIGAQSAMEIIRLTNIYGPCTVENDIVARFCRHSQTWDLEVKGSFELEGIVRVRSICYLPDSGTESIDDTKVIKINHV